MEDEQPCPIPLDVSIGENKSNKDESEMKSEGRVVNVRNEDELEVLCNLGCINLSEAGESITEEYKN